MDFLRLGRTRSRSSSKSSKRTPQPSPSGHPDSLQPVSPVVTSLPALVDHRDVAASAGWQTAVTDDSSRDGLALSTSSTRKTMGMNMLGNGKPALGVQVVEFSCFPSLLSPPNPAFVHGSEVRGILLNAQRPAPATSGETSKDELGKGVTQNLASSTTGSLPTAFTNQNIQNSTTLGPTKFSGLSQSRPHLRNSISADSVKNFTLVDPLATNAATTSSTRPGGVPPGSSNGGGSSGSKNGASGVIVASPSGGRIRFAPLPDPRSRRYSTGRDVWYDEDSENHVHLKGRDGFQATPGSWEAGDSLSNGASMQSESLAMSLGSTGESSSYYRDEQNFLPVGSGKSHKRSSSTLSKLLQPLKLGRSKSRDNNSQPLSPDGSLINSPPNSSFALAQWLNGGEPLSRSISSGAGSIDLDRQRREEFRSSGVPLKKSFSQEVQGAPVRRVAYPSVAQGGTRRRDAMRQGPTGPKIEEPEFVEWSNPSLGGSATNDEDDGSGMAWLKKRRAEKERKAKEEAHMKADSTDDSLHVAQDEGQADTNAADRTPKGAQSGQPSSSSAPCIKSDKVTSDAPSVETMTEVERTSLSDMASKDDDDSDQDAVEYDENEVDEGNEDDKEEMTVAELEEEDRLNEEARRTTGGASREVYHSHEHQHSTYTFEKSGRVSGASSLSLPPFERKNSLASSLKLDMPRSMSMSNSHPGDWGVKDSMVPTC